MQLKIFLLHYLIVQIDFFKFPLQKTVRKFSLHKIKGPVSFKKRTGGAFDKVVIFTEVGGGHFNNDIFHAFQVS